MDASPHLLQPAASTTLAVKVFAPPDATPSDRVSVFILARSIPELQNETVVQSNLTLFANAVAPKPTTTTPAGIAIPGFEVVAVVLAMAASIVLRPRRRTP